MRGALDVREAAGPDWLTWAETLTRGGVARWGCEEQKEVCDIDSDSDTFQL